MVFYQNTGGDNSDSIVIEPSKPKEDVAILLSPEFEFLDSFDFKNFNYFSFEQDITDMSSGEFEWWYIGTFEPWLFKVDDKYLDIDFESIYYKFSNQDEKRVFLLKIVNFIMFLLPYQILRSVFSKLDIDDISEFQVFLEEDMNLVYLREEIIQELDHNMTQFDDFVRTLLHFEKVAKKNLVEENIELLDEHVKKQNLFLEIFKGIMQETDMHKFKDLMEIMISKDEKNLF
jgi:hypothetical protein